MKQLVKLVIAALIANAVWRVGSEYVTHLRFREAVRVASVAAGSTDDPLREAIEAQAVRYGVPMTGEDLTIQRGERRIAISGSYRKIIQVFPGYDYPWTFNWATEVFVAPSVNQSLQMR